MLRGVAIVFQSLSGLTLGLNFFMTISSKKECWFQSLSGLTLGLNPRDGRVDDIRWRFNPFQG